jgi:NAD(P)-dependent dehydrogenase (short-subunit alcohol dehydrogenase family)
MVVCDPAFYSPLGSPLGDRLRIRVVTGGTGTLGRHVVRRLRDAGCEYGRSPDAAVALHDLAASRVRERGERIVSHFAHYIVRI